MRRTRQTIKFDTEYVIEENITESTVYKVVQMFEVDPKNEQYVARTDVYRYIEYHTEFGSRQINEIIDSNPKYIAKIIEKKTGMLVKF